jgi:hypothetical protein
MSIYEKPNLPSSGIHEATGDTVGETLQHPDFLPDLLAIEKEARRLGSSELTCWAAELKNAELYLIRGEPVPAVAIVALQERMREFLPQDGPAVEEVIVGG